MRPRGGLSVVGVCVGVLAMMTISPIASASTSSNSKANSATGPLTSPSRCGSSAVLYTGPYHTLTPTGKGVDTGVNIFNSTCVLLTGANERAERILTTPKIHPGVTVPGDYHVELSHNGTEIANSSSYANPVMPKTIETGWVRDLAGGSYCATPWNELGGRYYHPITPVCWTIPAG